MAFEFGMFHEFQCPAGVSQPEAFAESFEQARDASFLVKTEYASQEPVASWDAGMAKSFTPKDVGGEKADIEFWWPIIRAAGIKQQ